MTTRGFVFIGERRSARAVQMNVTWLDGRLAAKTLFGALWALGFDPGEHCYANWFHDGSGAFVPDPDMPMYARQSVFEGWSLVALGQRVHRALVAEDLPHLTLVHPAARGKIRRTANYRAHVAALLLPEVGR